MKLDYNSPVILTFALACLLATFLLEQVSDQWLIFFAVDGHFDGPMDFLNVFTYVLGHGSWSHLLGNMILLLLIGPVIEERHSSFGTFLMIGVTALLTGVLNNLFFDTGLLGSSGIVFMMIVLISFSNVKRGRIPVTFILIAILYLGREVFASISQDDSVSQFAHIVGGLVGAAFGLSGVFVKEDTIERLKDIAE